MAKAFSTYTLLQGKEPLLRRVVCEVRYEDGQLYLDRCGRLLKKLLKTAPEWVVTASPSPQGSAIYHIRAGTQLALSMHSTSLTLDTTATDEVIDTSEVHDFIEQVDSVFGLV